MEALKRTVREYERQLQQAKVSAEDDLKRAEADRNFAQKQVILWMAALSISTTTTTTSTIIVITVVIITASSNACLTA